MKAVRALQERSLLLEQAATSSGVLEYLRRPKAPAARGKPNELFLRNTLRSVFSSNKRAQEDEMWENRQQQLKRIESERSGDRSEPQGVSLGLLEARADVASRGKGEVEDEVSSSSSSGDSAGKRAEDDEGWIMTEEELQAMLSRHRARGRGGVGSRVDQVGPSLPPQDEAEVRGREDVERIMRGLLKGPEAPSWMNKRSIDDLLEMEASELSRRIKESKKRRKKEKDKKVGKRKEKDKKKRKKDKKSKKEKQ